MYSCLGYHIAEFVPICKILEKHFTSEETWPGPDIEISLTPNELKDLIIGSNAIHKSLGGTKNFLKEEEVTAKFAYSSVVTISDIKDVNIDDLLNRDQVKPDVKLLPDLNEWFSCIFSYSCPSKANCGPSNVLQFLGKSF